MKTYGLLECQQLIRAEFHCTVKIKNYAAGHMLKMILKDSTLFLFFRDIDVIEWHEFLTPQLKLSQLFKAKPQGDVSYRLLG